MSLVSAQVLIGTEKPWYQDVFETIWNTIYYRATFETIEGKFFSALIAFMAIAGLLIVIIFLLQGCTKLIKAIADVRRIPKGRDGRTALRRRKQFCRALHSDLLVLGKAENWNDQYFTDLEAEVELEGRFYDSTLHKLFRYRSQGLRRVPSLIQAIESSAEQTLLLVGQPGSGKSIALRHLAHQLAERATKLKSKEAVIPLYVNLKEFDLPTGQELNADFVKQFVIDNVRRGDADTAAFIQEHWEDYRSRGVWFFLFDSFDEIPAVLHAPTDSPVIRGYTEAIRHFLDGMSSCRGIVASREYKGPSCLPWRTVRILPLGPKRQDELIENSFLNEVHKAKVRTYIGGGRCTVADNPLFLTLACRYVKDHNRVPINDHQLLSGHLESLARRDVDYLYRRYRLSAEQLITGARLLAARFAECDSLSLAPTQAEIESEIRAQEIPGGNLETLLSALVDVKIGRCDVPQARAGDRRFTFSHRRYQETLFVEYLASRPNHIPADQLLMDVRWREYLVTFLETQEYHFIEPILNAAVRLIRGYPSISCRRQIPFFRKLRRCYYEWNECSIAPVLNALQEGMARRLEDVPDVLRVQVGEFLRPRWEGGDLFDRRMVLVHGGLLPRPILEEYIRYAIRERPETLAGVAFLRVKYLTEISEELVVWVREQLSDRALRYTSRVDLLQLEAYCERLPPYVGGSIIIRRCQLLKKLNFPAHILSIMVLFPAMWFLRTGFKGKGFKEFSEPISSRGNWYWSHLPLELIGALYMLFLISVFILKPQTLLAKECFSLFLVNECVQMIGGIFSAHWGAFVSLGCIIVVYFSAISIVYLSRSVGVEGGPLVFFKELANLDLKRGSDRNVSPSLVVVAAVAIYVAPGFLVQWVRSLYGETPYGLLVYPFTALGVSSVVLFGILGKLEIDKWRFRRCLRAARQLKDGALARIFSARSFLELKWWLHWDSGLIEPGEATARYALCAITGKMSGRGSQELRRYALLGAEANGEGYAEVLVILMRNVRGSVRAERNRIRVRKIV